MIIRNHLKWSVRALVILSVVCFAMIFVITLTLIENLHNQIRIFSPMTLNDYSSWGQIPGALNYTYTK